MIRICIGFTWSLVATVLAILEAHASRIIQMDRFGFGNARTEFWAASATRLHSKVQLRKIFP